MSSQGAIIPDVDKQEHEATALGYGGDARCSALVTCLRRPMPMLM